MTNCLITARIIFCFWQQISMFFLYCSIVHNEEIISYRYTLPNWEELGMVELLFVRWLRVERLLWATAKGNVNMFFSYIYDVWAYLHFDVFFMLLLVHISYFHAAPFSNITSTSRRGTLSRLPQYFAWIQLHVTLCQYFKKHL